MTCLVTDDKADLPAVQYRRVETKCLVGYDEDGGGRTTTMLTHELS